MSGFVFLHDQSQPLDFSAVFGAGRHDIDTGRIDAAVPQNICQFGDIFLDAVEGSGKEFSQIVRKDLAGIHPGSLT